MLLGAATLGLLVVLAPVLLGTLAYEQPARLLTAGNLIMQADNPWVLAMPNDAGASAGEYVVRHPVESLLLAVDRVAIELAHVRPTFTSAHNLAIAALLLLVYPLAGLGAWRARRRRLTQLIAATFWSQLLTVTITGADWDGRYLMFAFPLVLIFAGCGASRVAALIQPSIATSQRRASSSGAAALVDQVPSGVRSRPSRPV